MKRSILLSTAVLVMALLGAQGSAEAQKKNLAMGSTQASSGNYAYFVGAAKAINLLVPDVNVSVVETGATVDNLKRMQKGLLDLGLASTDQTYLAWKGEDIWKDSPFEGVRLLWMYSISANLVVVREETGIKSIYELSGKKFNPGFRGSAVEKSSEVAFGVLGIKPDWQRMGTADVVDAMKDKRIVGFAKAGAGYGHDASTMDIATQVPLRTLPYSEEDMKKIKAARPHIPWVKVPAGSIKGMGEFWTTVSLGFVAGSKDMPPELAYRLVKAIWEGQEHQPQSVMGVAYKNPGLSAQLALSPLHAGAIKYYRELGFKVPDHLVPPEAK